MSFINPGWLALFAPFAAMVWWTLRSTPGTLPTTSAFLWPTTSIASSARSKRRPPAWTIAAMSSIACAIVGLAGPARSDRAAVFVVVDPSYQVTAGDAASAWVAIARSGATATLVVPGQPDATTLAGIRPTARPTTDEVAASVARLRREDRDVIVVSDAAIEPSDRALVVAPTPPAVDAWIERIGARSNGGAVDVFVRAVRTLGAPLDATLFVRSGEAAVERQPIVWNGKTSVDALVRLPRAGNVIDARVSMTGDATTIDDVARLARDRSSNVRVVVDGGLQSSLVRFAGAYARVHAVDVSTPSVDVRLTRDARPADRAIIVANGPSIAEGPTRRIEHAILAGVDLDALPSVDAPMPAGFEAIAWRGDRPIVATRDADGRRSAWIALDAEVAARVPAFVVLLDQSVRWTAGSTGDVWSAVTTGAVPLIGWRAVDVTDTRVDASPGLYADESGQQHAVNLAPSATSVRDITGDKEKSLATWLASRRARSARPLDGRALALAATFAALSTAFATAPRLRRRYLDVRAVRT